MRNKHNAINQLYFNKKLIIKNGVADPPEFQTMRRANRACRRYTYFLKTTARKSHSSLSLLLKVA